MKQMMCPRCQEPFEQNEHACKNCGIKKSQTISNVRWSLRAVFVDLALTGIFAGIREKVITAQGYVMDLANGKVWFILGVVFILFLLPIICVYFIYKSFILRERGVMTTGTVVENYTETIGQEICHTSAITFTPEVAHPSLCRVTADGWLTIGSTVDVIYDPYHPGDYATVGKMPTLAVPIIAAILGLAAAALAIIVMGAFLITPPNVYL